MMCIFVGMVVSLLNATVFCFHQVRRFEKCVCKHKQSKVPVDWVENSPSIYESGFFVSNLKKKKNTFMSFSNTWFSFLVSKKANYPMGLEFIFHTDFFSFTFEM